MLDHIVSYIELQKYITLFPEEKERDVLLLSSIHEYLEDYTDRKYLLEEYEQRLKVEGSCVTLRNWPIQRIISVIDERTKEDITEEAVFISDEKDRTISLPEVYEGHIVNITYEAGYEAGKCPSRLKEALVRFFKLEKEASNGGTINKERLAFFDYERECLQRMIDGLVYKRY